MVISAPATQTSHLPETVVLAVIDAFNHYCTKIGVEPLHDCLLSDEFNKKREPTPELGALSNALQYLADAQANFDTNGSSLKISLRNLGMGAQVSFSTGATSKRTDLLAHMLKYIGARALLAAKNTDEPNRFAASVYKKLEYMAAKQPAPKV